MPFFLLSILLQVACLVHAVRTGRDRIWIYVIIIGSMIGCLAYLIVELVPAMASSRGAQRARKSVAKTFDPTKDLRQHARAMTINNSVGNVIAFAEECLQTGHHNEAIDAAQNARKGLFLHDPNLLQVLAKAQFAAGRYQDARQTLDELIAANPDFKSADSHLLYARSLEALGELAAAKTEFAALSQYYPGPVAKLAYARLLRKLGETAEAKVLLDDLLLGAEHAPSFYRQQYKEELKAVRDLRSSL
ncbi:tetratricopeptide repeat protein [Permianibacter sp. IMCC34836]|uniref:tetratricopeptide repeat protein n=1 Tax=Permianibacter fluminis TaxID=2738515 RepID=UPI00155467E1|nr:tetratricopeptide repeat protein [Permianibacter fluminis]NQD37349.1 tetratricopeptide repeat protein [Permianibacter fluminis]